MSEKLRLWIDDIRPAPEGWFHIKSVNEFKDIYDMLTARYKENQIEIVSLDYDSGIYYPFGGDYINILNYLEYRTYHCPNLAIPNFHIHSYNPAGTVNMRAIIERNDWKEVNY